MALGIKEIQVCYYDLTTITIALAQKWRRKGQWDTDEIKCQKIRKIYK